MPPLFADTGCSVSDEGVFRCKKMGLGVRGESLGSPSAEQIYDL